MGEPLDLFTIAGFAGAALVVLAYLANQTGRLPSDDWRFPMANLVGAALIMTSLFTQWNFPSVVIEAFWIAISIYGVAKAARRR
jgi:hypothetical protein